MWRNSNNTYGLVHITLHWLMAAVVAAMFALGLYMVDLSYYDAWYHRAPALHKSVGLLLIGVFFLRLFWKFTNARPPLLTRNQWLNRAATAVHALLYLVLFGLLASGYLIASADGRPISVFEWFSVPAVQLPLNNQEDLAGDVHEIAAWLLVGLAVLHGTAALKHHFIDRDESLKRMLWPRPAYSGKSEGGGN